MSKPMARRLVSLAIALVLVAVAVRVAWLGDDAFITLRTVENWCSGCGLRWNPADRVQTFTHPLWMLLLAGGRALTGEVYFTTITLSLLVSATAILLLLRRAVRIPAMLAIGFLLLGTRAFTDYTTSGLETPLLYLLLVLFAGVAAGERPVPERFAPAVLFASLAATTRMDMALLCAPAVLAMVPTVGWRTTLQKGLLASAPFLGWILFAAIWFGSALPITAHAKAFGLGIPTLDLVVQGLRYAAFALTDDPLLLPTVVLGLGAGLLVPATRWLALGGVLYCGYVVKVGGDFMAGRFFLPPFVIAVAILARALSRRPQRAFAVAIGALLLAAMGGVPQWTLAPERDTPPTDEQIHAQHGIVDERRVYYPQLGLWSPTRRIPVRGELDELGFPEGRTAPWIFLSGAVGIPGFQMSERGHLLDPLLCDPLLARLPARDPTRWRIGHVLRRIPEGYYESLASGENRLHHAGLRAYYGQLLQQKEGPLFASSRWAAILGMGVGAYDQGLRDFVATDYRQPPRLPAALGELTTEAPLGAYWFDVPSCRIVYEGGLAVDLGEARRARTVRMQVFGHFVGYRLQFVRDGRVLGGAAGEPEPVQGLAEMRALAGVHEERFVVPAEVVEFDTLWIDFTNGPISFRSVGPAAIGALRLLP